MMEHLNSAMETLANCDFLDFASHLKKKNKFRVIDRDGDPYLIRYYLIRESDLGVYLHQFFDSDRDTWLHDHPWNSGNILLKNGYYEELFDSNMNRYREWRNRGYFGSRNATTFHRIIIPNHYKGKVWTLFWRGPKLKDWGFLVDDEKWVQHDEYLRGDTSGMDIVE